MQIQVLIDGKQFGPAGGSDTTLNSLTFAVLDPPKSAAAP